MPPNSCTQCGDGTEPGHELCAGCEQQRERPRWQAPLDNSRFLGRRRARR